jgi:hypothetical protein
MPDTFTQPELFRLTRTGDPETSHDAAASLRDVRASQRRVYELLRDYGPCTDEELQALAPRDGFLISPSGLRTRRHELVVLGFVKDSGRRTTMSTGRQAIIWEAANRE